MNKLALSINGQQINAPSDVPQLSSATDINKIIGIGIDILMIAAVLICTIYLIWGAIDYITSTGDKTKVHSARDKIIFSIIGLVIVIIAFFIVSGLGSIFNITLF